MTFSDEYHLPPFLFVLKYLAQQKKRSAFHIYGNICIVYKICRSIVYASIEMGRFKTRNWPPSSNTKLNKQDELDLPSCWLCEQVQSWRQPWSQALRRLEGLNRSLCRAPYLSLRRPTCSPSCGSDLCRHRSHCELGSCATVCPHCVSARNHLGSALAGCSSLYLSHCPGGCLGFQPTG